MQGAERQHDREGRERVGEPVHRAAGLQGERPAGRRSEREPGRERRPELHRLARDVEALPEPDQRGEQEEARRGLLDVEPLGEVGERDRHDEGDPELPRAAAARGQGARQPDEAEAEGERRDPRRRGDLGREHAAYEIHAGGELRGQRRGDAQAADRGREPGEGRLASNVTQAHVLRVAP
jgi:hypothetical protein